MLFIPLLTITIAPLEGKDISQGTALTNTLRQLGGSFGIAAATTFISVRNIFHYNNLTEHVSVYNQPTYDRLNSLTALFVSKGSDINTAQLKAAAAMKGTVFKQSMLLTYNDVFLIVGVFFAICIPLLLLFKAKKKTVEGQVKEGEEQHMEMVME